jgi:hypothetical protein
MYSYAAAVVAASTKEKDMKTTAGKPRLYTTALAIFIFAIMVVPGRGRADDDRENHGRKLSGTFSHDLSTDVILQNWSPIAPNIYGYVAVITVQLTGDLSGTKTGVEIEQFNSVTGEWHMTFSFAFIGTLFGQPDQPTVGHPGSERFGGNSYETGNPGTGEARQTGPDGYVAHFVGGSTDGIHYTGTYEGRTDD